MNHPGLRTLILLWAISPSTTCLPAASQSKDQEIMNQAKVLMFDQKWEDARQAFQRLIREFPQSSFLPEAYFRTAYCLRLEKKPEEALLAYEQFLKKYPNEPFFGVEAKQVVVELAASLVEQKKLEYRNRLITALSDPQKEVRYFAAIRCSSLKDRQLDPKIVPVLKEILAKEKQREILDRASIALLAVEPAALAQPQQQKPAKSGAKQGGAAVNKMFHLRIYEGDESKKPVVELDFPVSLAQLAVAALDEPTKSAIRKKGIDIDNVWESLNRLGPTNILTIRSDHSVVKLWIQ